MKRLEDKQFKTPILFARQWSVMGFTVALIIFAALLPVFSVLLINFWLDGQIDWNEAILELGAACVTLSLICYPAFYLLQWEALQIKRWDATNKDFILLMEQSVDMVILSSKNGQIKEVNQKTCDLLGYSKDELLKMSTLDLDVDCQLYREPRLEKAILNGQTIYYETIFRHKNGNKLPVESRAKLASWLGSGHYVQFISDISKRRKAEKELVDSHEELEKKRNLLEARIAEHSSEIRKQKHGRELAEQQFDAIQVYLVKLIDSMPSVIIALDLKQNILQWNKEAENTTGKKLEDVIGKSLEEAYPKLEREISKASHRQDLLQQTIHFRFKQKIDLTTKVLEVMIYPIFSDQQVEQSKVIRIDDVTEKLRIDETLVQTEKMLSLGGLAAGMAHEINNPLGAIIQSTQNIKRRLSDDLMRNHVIAEKSDIELEKVLQYVEEQRIISFLDGILTSGKRAADIVGDMLNFAKPISTESTQIDLIDALDAAIRLSEKDYNQKKQFDFRDIEIRKTYSSNVGKITAQKNQVEQVFLNLLVNAAQALASKTIDNQSPLIEIIVRKEGQMVVVDVIDNGPGMTEEIRKRVFEPFFTTKDEKTGTGLGLSVSYFIVTEQLGGLLNVESQPNKGCRFTIRLPIKQRNDDSDDDKDEQIELPLT
ncbi:MAG: PAS domain S-box-containing protein [Polaribacter sp.]|jgi:PAS domain S-box-containing protein